MAWENSSAVTVAVVTAVVARARIRLRGTTAAQRKHEQEKAKKARMENVIFHRDTSALEPPSLPPETRPFGRGGTNIRTTIVGW